MVKAKFSLTKKLKQEYLELIKGAGHKTLAVWAIDCAERVMPYFEERFPQDLRPRKALETLQAWIDTAEFKMSSIRGASLASHAAAKAVGDDNPARSAAHAAGQAVATAHVPTHAIGAAIYALQAVFRAAEPADAEAAVVKERQWQSRHLRKLREKDNIF